MNEAKISTSIVFYTMFNEYEMRKASVKSKLKLKSNVNAIT